MNDARQLSAPSTVVYKVVVPVLSFAVVGSIAVFGISLGLTTLSVGLAAFFVAGGAYITWFARRLKWVSLRGDVLVVAGYRHTAEVPLAAVERISESILYNPRLLILDLKQPSQAGKRIVFVVRQPDAARTRQHPMVRELRELARQ